MIKRRALLAGHKGFDEWGKLPSQGCAPPLGRVTVIETPRDISGYIFFFKEDGAREEPCMSTFYLVELQGLTRNRAESHRLVRKICFSRKCVAIRFLLIDNGCVEDRNYILLKMEFDHKSGRTSTIYIAEMRKNNRILFFFFFLESLELNLRLSEEILNIFKIYERLWQIKVRNWYQVIAKYATSSKRKVFSKCRDCA